MKDFIDEPSAEALRGLGEARALAHAHAEHLEKCLRADGHDAAWSAMQRDLWAAIEWIDAVHFECQVREIRRKEAAKKGKKKRG